MPFDIDTLEALRRQHPAWRLLLADSAALVASFLHRTFVLPNRRVIAQADLAEALEDTLYALRQQRSGNVYPKPALEYLNDWAANDKAWLRDCELHYWGDIDTHGFAILDQLRSHFAQARSFLMDRDTLLAHRSQRTDEPQPTQRELPRLRDDERRLYDDLRWRRLRDEPLRLEQERIAFGRIEAALAAL